MLSSLCSLSLSLLHLTRTLSHLLIVALDAMSITDHSDKRSTSSVSGSANRDVERSPMTLAEPPKFTWSSLWKQPVINPLNGQCLGLLASVSHSHAECGQARRRRSRSSTSPIPTVATYAPSPPLLCSCRLTSARLQLHLSWLAFFVAFLSWFAFPPLVPEAIREDLNLTRAELGNSNITALSATLGIRFVCGPLVDRFGPRWVMVWLLVLGAIPSGLAGTISNAVRTACGPTQARQADPWL